MAEDYAGDLSPGEAWALLEGDPAAQLIDVRSLAEHLGKDVEPDVTIETSADTAWRVFAKGMTGPEARNLARVAGDQKLAEPFFSTLAITA